jgi:hypothetical protein
MSTIPKWFYVVTIIALLWNLLGAAAVGMNLFITPEQLAQLPEQQKVMHEATPSWTVLASIIAVVAGTIGCLALLAKKVLAEHILIVSVIALVIQDIGIFIVVDGVGLAGISALIMQTMVFIIGCALVLLAKKAKREGWLS